MEANSKATYQNVINFVAIQQLQELAEVWRKTHHHSSFSAGKAYAAGGLPEFVGATRASAQCHQNH
jgi:hypothetical protein